MPGDHLHDTLPEKVFPLRRLKVIMAGMTMDNKRLRGSVGAVRPGRSNIPAAKQERN
jgi:hypothetical protein